ncbi:MAG: DHH family phosphoesterase [Candidatus Aminicenantes bacterium]|nr:DHH family phosphoesterase [Candidatus Aminicenantes bacterium]
MDTTPLDLIVKKISASRRLAITSHLRPDGDSLCTSLALAFAAEDMGKEADIFNTDRTPVPFHAFPDAERIRIGQIPPGVYDAIILLECADVSRSGHEHLDGYFKINIDHHYSNDRYADINWVEPTASAVGEMAFDLCLKLPLRLTPRIAGLLYCAIVSDTGSFQFSNTTAKCFEVCHALVEAGADPNRTSEALFHNNPPEKIKLLGRVLSTLDLNRDGSIAMIHLFKRDLRSLNLSAIDTEDITTLARSIKGVNVVLFFKEMDVGVFRVSIRSKGTAHAAAIAEHFGGGGHAHAAGFTVYGPIEELMKNVLATVEKLLGEMAPGRAATT